MELTIQSGSVGKGRIIGVFSLISIFSCFAFGQQPTCTVSAGSPTVHAVGLAEQLGDITFTCSGGSGTVNTILFVGISANITNRLDAGGNLANVKITGAATAQTPPTLNSPNTVAFFSLQLPGAAASF